MQFSALVISRNPIAREGLCRIIAAEGFKVSASASSADDLVFDQDHHADLGIIDVPTVDEQIASVQSIGSRSNSKTVVLAERFDLSGMLSCFSQGAHGYIVKDMPCSTLIASLRLSALGHKLMPSELSDWLTQDMIVSDAGPVPAEPSHIASKLSQRERDVLMCLVSGDPNKVIARRLAVSEATIKVHVKAILRKLDVVNRTQAAIWARSRGMTGSMVYAVC